MKNWHVECQAKIILVGTINHLIEAEKIEARMGSIRGFTVYK